MELIYAKNKKYSYFLRFILKKYLKKTKFVSFYLIFSIIQSSKLVIPGKIQINLLK